VNSEKPIAILFVCMGNICRSPAAECLMRSLLEEKQLEKLFTIDSAGTGNWHAGNKPDRRMRKAAKLAGKTIEGSARQVQESDFSEFDWIFCMDNDNYANLISMGANPEKTHLLLEFVSHQTITEVPDPYYGGSDGFTNVINLIDGAVCDLIDHLISTTT